MDNRPLDAAALGRLLLMQSVLWNLPDDQSILDFVCRGLADLPGIQEVGHRLEATPPAARDSAVRLPLQVGAAVHGELVIQLRDAEVFGHYEPYIRNFLLMVGVILEGRRQRELIEQHQEELEMTVHDRTRELTDEIAARQAVAEELRRSRNMLAHTLDSIPQAVFWKDRDGLYLGCNRAFALAAGLGDPSEIVGKTDFEMPWRECAEAYLADDREVMRSGRPKRHIIEPLRQHDGKDLWLDTTKVPLTGADGQVVAVLGVYDDITERLLAENERQKLQTQLLQAQKMDSVGRLAGGVAHDFNNMLQTILGNSSLLLASSGLDPEKLDWLREIEKAAKRSAELTRQLLAFARKQVVLPRTIDLNETVEHMLKMLRRLIGEQIQLAWQPGNQVWPVCVDPSQIDQILVNLTVNARDAISGHGHITISTANVTLMPGDALAGVAPGDYVSLKLSDTGCGMDSETLGHLFEPFFTTKEIGHGTGLGLATVHGIVQQNQGRIVVESQPGGGSSFTIQLPRSTASVTPEQAVSGKAAPSGTETILLVEDEQQVLTLTKRLLARQGYKVLTANQPAEALKLLDTHAGSVHLLLTDLIMPGMDGRELHRRIAERMPGIRCLYVSGYAASTVTNNIVGEPGVQFLSKPFAVDTLLTRVRELLDLPSAE